MNDMSIDTQRAEINTLSVTIRALHIDKKQMTLAVFRQIPELDPERFKEADHWGVVAYGTSYGCDYWSVCTLGGRLFKMPIPRLPKEPPEKLAVEVPGYLSKDMQSKINRLAGEHARRIKEYLFAKDIHDGIQHEQLFIAV